jgi:hypothetical protein
MNLRKKRFEGQRLRTQTGQQQQLRHCMMMLLLLLLLLLQLAWRMG